MAALAVEETTELEDLAAQCLPRSLLAEFEAVSDYPGQPDAAPLVPRKEPQRDSRLRRFAVPGLLGLSLVAAAAVLARGRRGEGSGLVFQSKQQSSTDCSRAEVGDRCFEHVTWAKEQGIYEHPEWYEGLTPSSSLEDFQRVLFERDMGGCGRPCASSEAAEAGGHLRNRHSGDRSSKKRSLEASRARKDAHKKSAAPGQSSQDSSPALPAASKPKPQPAYPEKEPAHSTAGSDELGRRHHDEVLSPAETTKDVKEDCRDAVAGDQCYGQVKWAMTTGIQSNPEWYPGLREDSSFQDFQAFLSSEGRDNCERPCAEASWDGLPGESAAAKSRNNKPVGTDAQAQIAAGLADGPTLFCWMLFKSHTYESGLVQLELTREFGIFGCDAYALFTDHPTTLSDGTRTTPLGEIRSAPSEWGSVLNTEPFMKAWTIIGEDGSFKEFDWTVKADADAVFFPERLKLHLADVPKNKPIWVQNSIGNTPLLGPLEVFSKQAVQLFADKGKSCARPEVLNTTGEDGFISMCMREIGAEAWMDLAQLRSTTLVEDCREHWNVVYHPFKDVSSYIACELATSGHQYQFKK